MSELPHTTGQYDPTQYDPTAEITQEQMLAANPEDIVAAANDQIARMESHRDTLPADSMQRKHANSQIGAVGQARTQARDSKRASHFREDLTFNQFLAEKMTLALENKDYDDYDSLQKTEQWFEGQTASDRGNLGNILRIKQEQQVTEQQSAPQPEARPARDPQVEAAQQKQAVEDARKSLEKMYGVELFDDIVKIGKNRTQLNTDVNGGFKNIGDGPSSDAKLTNMERFKQRFKRDNKAADWRQELNETVLFSDVVERETRQVTVPQETKGRFGRTHKWDYTKTETIPGSEHPKMIRNELTGQDEPAIRFKYDLNLRSTHAMNAQHKGELPKYQEFGGHRLGQVVTVGVELPKSVADSLQSQIRKDPASVRTLVEKLFLENSNGQMMEEYWRQGNDRVKHPIRPPYEQLPSDWNMAIVTSQEGEGSSGDYTIDRVRVQQ